MNSSVTVVTTAFGRNGQVREWADAWYAAGCRRVVCDNGGTISDGFPDGTDVLPYQGNSGFGAGINRAAMKAETPLILITNPDTLPCDESHIDRFLELHTVDSISGGLTVDRLGAEVHSTGIWPSLAWVRKQLFRPAETLWRSGRADWVQGSLMLVERSAFLELGGFHGDYPLYFEDTDFCARAVNAGMKIRIQPESRFIHQEGTGSSGSSAVRLSCFHWGLVEFFKNHIPEEARTARRLVLTKCLLRTFALGLLRPDSAAGYRRALKSLLSNTPPRLPEKSNG